MVKIKVARGQNADIFSMIGDVVVALQHFCTAKLLWSSMYLLTLNLTPSHIQAHTHILKE